MFQEFLNKIIWITYLNEGRTREVSSLLISLDTTYLPFCTTVLTVSRTKCPTTFGSMFLLERNVSICHCISIYIFVLGCLCRLDHLRMETDPCEGPVIMAERNYEVWNCTFQFFSRFKASRVISENEYKNASLYKHNIECMSFCCLTVMQVTFIESLCETKWQKCFFKCFNLFVIVSNFVRL